MEDKPVAIVLGGTFPHIALVKNLKKRGYYTLLIDYYDNPPAKVVADEHIQESTLNKNQVLTIAKERQPQLIISVFIDQANVTACYVSEQLGLPVPYGYETSLLVTNKTLMKAKLVENDIPTSKFISVSNINDLKDIELDYPVIVKPTNSNSSKGVRKVENKDKLNQHVINALEISGSNEAIIEEFKTGMEIGIDCFIQNSEATILMTKERRKFRTNSDGLQQIYGCTWPIDISNNNYKNYKIVAEKIAIAFNLNNTPLMIQAIVDNNENINIIEFGARFGGGESFRIINLCTGFDITDAAVDSFLGIKVDISLKQPEFYYSDNFIYSKGGIFGGIDGYQKLIEDGTIEYIDAYKTKGMPVGSELSSNNRVGVFIVKSKEKDDLELKINKVIENIEVNDIHGNPMMRKDIY